MVAENQCKTHFKATILFAPLKRHLCIYRAFFFSQFVPGDRKQLTCLRQLFLEALEPLRGSASTNIFKSVSSSMISRHPEHSSSLRFSSLLWNFRNHCSLAFVPGLKLLILPPQLLYDPNLNSYKKIARICFLSILNSNLNKA